MPKITDPALLSQLETTQTAINKTGGGGRNARVPALDALSRQLQKTRELYEKNFKGVGPRSVLEYLPSQATSDFNSAAAGLSDQALSAFRVPGVGSQSDRELQSFVAANQPSNSDFDSGIERKLSNIEGRLVPQRRSLGLPDYAPPLMAKRPPTPKKARVIDFNALPE
jgi:hypothetical protein